MRDLAWRLNAAMQEADIPPEKLAGRMGVGCETIERWLDSRARPRARELRDLARLLDVEHDWLALGEGSRRPSQVEEVQADYGDEVREVNVISWSHAGEAATYEEMPRHWHGRVATTSRDKRAFALTVEGDCMLPDFKPGDRVILEPTHDPINGMPAVAKLVDDAIHLRIYTKLTDGTIRLTSLRPDIYPAIDKRPEEFHWIWPVRELVRSVRPFSTGRPT